MFAAVYLHGSVTLCYVRYVGSGNDDVQAVAGQNGLNIFVSAANVTLKTVVLLNSDTPEERKNNIIFDWTVIMPEKLLLE